MGVSLFCKVCGMETTEFAQHCLLECPPGKRVWEAFKKVWQEWRVQEDLTPSWPFILLGKMIHEHDDDPPNLQGYHTGSFTYVKQPLDILRCCNP